MYFSYKSNFPRTAEQANDYLKSEIAKGRKTFLSVTDETGKTVAWINGNGKNGAEKHHFIEVETKVKPAQEIKAEFPEKKIVPYMEEIFKTCDEYENETPVQIEETVEAAPVEMEENMNDVMNLAGQATVIIGKLAELASAKTVATVAAPVEKIIEKPIEKIIEKIVENPETAQKLAIAEQRLAKAAEAYKALEAEKKSMAEQLATMQTKIEELEKSWKGAVSEWKYCAAKLDGIEMSSVVAPETVVPETVAPETVATETVAPETEECPWGDSWTEDDEDEVVAETSTSDEIIDWDERPSADRFLDKNGVPFSYYGKCCYLWTPAEKALLDFAQQEEIAHMINEHFFSSIAGTPTDAEEIGVTKLIRPADWTSETPHDREFDFIWSGNCGQIDTEKLPAFKYRRTVDCSKYGMDRDMQLPSTIAYGKDYMTEAEGEDLSMMKIEQRMIDESGDVKQVSYTTLSDGRIAFRMKNGTISYDWYWSPEDYFRQSGCMKEVMNLSRKSSVEVRFCAMMAHSRSAQPVHELLDSLENTDEDRTFLRKYIDRYDIRVARPYQVTAMYNDRSTKELITFPNFWEVMMFEHTFNNDMDYTAGNAYVDECFMRQMHCKGSSDKANWIELAKHIDDAKARLNMSDYIGKAV